MFLVKKIHSFYKVERTERKSLTLHCPIYAVSEYAASLCTTSDRTGPSVCLKGFWKINKFYETTVVSDSSVQ